MRRRIAVIVAVLLGAAGVLVWLEYRATEEAFQRDADVYRLRHLEHYGNLIEEYRHKAGRYPLQGIADVPVYVHIANDQQAPYARKGPPYPHRLVGMEDFFAEIEEGLGRPVEERFDPQYRPAGRPNFYIYMVEKDYYFFAVHLDGPYPFAKFVAPHYFKAEISNVASAQNRASRPFELFSSPEFMAAIEAPVSKPRFFDEREKKYEHFTKGK